MNFVNNPGGGHTRHQQIQHEDLPGSPEKGDWNRHRDRTVVASVHRMTVLGNLGVVGVLTVESW